MTTDDIWVVYDYGKKRIESVHFLQTTAQTMADDLRNTSIEVSNWSRWKVTTLTTALQWLKSAMQEEYAELLNEYKS